MPSLRDKTIVCETFDIYYFPTKIINLQVLNLLKT